MNREVAGKVLRHAFPVQQERGDFEDLLEKLDKVKTPNSKDTDGVGLLVDTR